MKNKTLRKTSKNLNKRKNISGGEVLQFEEKNLNIAIKNLLEGVAKIKKDTLIELLNMYTHHQRTIIGLLTPNKNLDEIIDTDKITALFVAIQSFCHKHLDAGLNTFAIVVRDIILRFYHSTDDTDYLYSIANALEVDYNTCTQDVETCNNTKGVLKILHGYVNILHITDNRQINDMLGVLTLDFRNMKKIDENKTTNTSNIGPILCIIDSLKELGAPTSDHDNNEAVKLILDALKEYLKPVSLTTTIKMVMSAFQAASNSTVKSIIGNSIQCTLTSRQKEFAQLSQEKSQEVATIEQARSELDRQEISSNDKMIDFLEKKLQENAIKRSERKRKKPSMFSTLFKGRSRGGKTRKKRS